jgi:hypothetical protein
MRGSPPQIDLDTLGKKLPKLGLGKYPLERKVFLNVNTLHYETLPLKEGPPGKGVLTHGKLKPLDIILPLS